MPLQSQNYGLQNNWMNSSYQQPISTPTPSVAGSGLMGALSGLPLGPIGALGGGLMGMIGAGMQAGAANKQQKSDEAYRNKMFDYQKKQDRRAMGMNTINMMKDDFKTALYRSLTGGA